MNTVEGEPMLMTILSLSMTLAAETPRDAPPPQMRVAYGDLDFTRAEGVRGFTERLSRASTAFCARHRALVTPAHVRQARYCERAVSAEAVRGLPREQWRLYVRAAYRSQAE